MIIKYASNKIKNISYYSRNSFYLFRELVIVANIYLFEKNKYNLIKKMLNKKIPFIMQKESNFIDQFLYNPYYISCHEEFTNCFVMNEEFEKYNIKVKKYINNL